MVSDEEASESFFRLLLETFTQWINQYPMKEATSEKSEFVKKYNQLLGMGVAFPENFEFEGSAFNFESQPLFRLSNGKNKEKVPFKLDSGRLVVQNSKNKGKKRQNPKDKSTSEDFNEKSKSTHLGVPWVIFGKELNKQMMPGRLKGNWPV